VEFKIQTAKCKTLLDKCLEPLKGNIASRNQVRSYSAAELPAVKAFRKPYTLHLSTLCYIIHAVCYWFQYPGMLLPEGDRRQNSLL